MSLGLNRLWLLPALLLASQAWALGLGDIRLSSALNEPLRAEIELLAATPEELENLTIQLASNETFDRYDLDRPLFLSRLQFRLVRSGTTEGNIVRITSQEPVTEPFITFLVEAVWSRGRLLREYTLLLDPPTFAPPPVTQSTQPVTAPTRATQTDSGQIQRPVPQTPEPVAEPAPAPQPVMQAPAQSDPTVEEPAPAAVFDEPEPDLDEPGFDTMAGGDIVVQRGDTLWAITSRVRPDSRLSMNQTMLAIFEANPQAFAGNINMMSAGASLRIPSADEVFRISRGDALAEVQRQNAAWGGGTDFEPQTQPALTLVPPDDDVSLFDDDTGQAPPDDAVDDAVADLISADEARINEIEGVLDDHQDSLIEISDNELAALRAELAELRGEPPPEPLPVDDIVDDSVIDDADDTLADDDLLDTDTDPTAVDDDLVVDDTFVDDTGPVVEDTTPAIEDTAPPPPQVVTTSTPRGQSLVDTILGYVNSIWGIIGGALVLALGLLVWFARRAGRGDDEDSTGVWESLEEQDDIDGESLASTERLRALASEDEAAIVVVEQETAPKPVEDSFDDALEDSLQDSLKDSSEDSLEDSMMDTFEMPIAEAETSEHQAIVHEAEPGPEPDAMHDPFAATVAEIDHAAPDELGATAEFAVPEESVVEEPLVEEEAPEPITPDQSLEDTFHSDTAINLDQADPVAEADFHMAYGLYDQAADLINGALGVEPEREDLLAKLCEIYFVWGNRDAFIDAAGRMRAVAGGDSNPEWDKIVIMGQQIASDHELFSGVSAAGATKAVDLSFEAGMDEAGDLDMDFEAGASGDDETQAVDLSFDGGTGEASALDMDFASGETADEGDDFIDVGDETVESPTVDTLLDDDTSEMPVSGEASDSPTIEQQFASMDATGEIPTATDIGTEDATEIANIFDADEPEPAKPIDATAEIDLDDLGLDLQGLDETQIAGDDDSLDDQIADLDETSESQTLEVDDNLTVTGKNLAVDEDLAAATGEVPSIEDTDVSIDVGLLDATGQTQVLPEDMPIDTAGEALGGDESTVLSADVDFDFAKTQALDETGEMPAVDTGVDLDLDDLTGVLEVSDAGDTMNADRDAETAEMPLMSDESPTHEAELGDLASDTDDARTMTEVGTKLDLARAYVDMGDPSGARNILEEVLNEGDEGQRQQAQQLLESMPS
jgi:pilus assembly protein FimV